VVSVFFDLSPSGSLPLTPQPISVTQMGFSASSGAPPCSSRSLRTLRSLDLMEAMIPRTVFLTFPVNA